MKDEQQVLKANEIYEALKAKGIDVLLDDRDERPGVKFKDMELIGIPFRITVGKGIKDGNVEWKERTSDKEDVSVEEIVEKALEALK